MQKAIPEESFAVQTFSPPEWKSCFLGVVRFGFSWAPLSNKKFPPENVDRICAININWNFIYPGQDRRLVEKVEKQYELNIIYGAFRLWNARSLKTVFLTRFEFFSEKSSFYVLCRRRAFSDIGINEQQSSPETTKLNGMILMCVQACKEVIAKLKVAGKLTIITLTTHHS